MAGICLPIDASAGSPSFPAAQHRVAQAALMGGVTGRPLGARSGVRPSSVPTLTLSGLSWTLTPFNGVLDPGTGLAVGPYLFAFLANETGSLNPQDATYPRVDRLDIQVPDDPPGALPRAAVIAYTAGAPASVPGTPAAPAQSMPLGTFSVPKSGNGNPAFTPAIPLTVAPGGVLPVPSVAQAGDGTYAGQLIIDLSTGAVLRWNGSAWRRPKGTAYTGSTSGGTTDSNGQLTISHNLGFVPSQLFTQATFAGVSGRWTAAVNKSSVTTTQAKVTIISITGGTNVTFVTNTGPITVDWQAFE